jgi:predicted dehydrogenase
MEKGVKYIFISKPIACSLVDAYRIMAKSIETNTRVIVDHGLRHDKTYNWIIEEQNKGSFGNLQSIHIQRPGIGLGCLGVHSFDLANFICGLRPERVSGWVDKPFKKNPRGEQFVDPGGLVILEYPGGIRAIIQQIEDGAGPMAVELNYQYARIRVDEKFGQLEVVAKDRSIQASPGKPVPFTKSINPHGIEVNHDIFFLMKCIIEELIQGNIMKADAVHGVISVEILVAAYMSSEKGNIPIPLPITNNIYFNKFLPVT